jgi:Cu-Zn family superoxide dismutase
MNLNHIGPVAACAAALAIAAPPAKAGESDHVQRAFAVVNGPGGIQGIVIFKQRACAGCPTLEGAAATDPAFRAFPEPSVEVVARISGPVSALAPGAHGMHLHEIGKCEEPGFTTAGGHFDPGPFGMSQPDANHPFHMGDLPNLIVGSRGSGFLRHTTSRITLSPGPLSVFDSDGTAVIVHLNPDRGTTGVPAGSGGPRIACGIVMRASAGDVDDDED